MVASPSPSPMTGIANILRENGQISSGTSFHSVKKAPAFWGLRPQSPIKGGKCRQSNGGTACVRCAAPGARVVPPQFANPHCAIAS